MINTKAKAAKIPWLYITVLEASFFESHFKRIISPNTAAIAKRVIAAYSIVVKFGLRFNRVVSSPKVTNRPKDIFPISDQKLNFTPLNRDY